MGLGALAWMADVPVFVPDVVCPRRPSPPTADVDRLLVELFHREGRSLVRLARLFVDDRNAAEDLVQEAFIRLARSAHRIQDDPRPRPTCARSCSTWPATTTAGAWCRSATGSPSNPRRAEDEDELVLRDDQRQVIDALRDLPHRQRDCLVLRYYQELGIDDIAATLGISRNSVKTHLQRGLAAMESLLGKSDLGDSR